MNAFFKFFLNIFPRTFLIRLSFLFRPCLKIIYRGSNYQDPIDGFSFRRFLPYGYQKQRPNVLSPSTLSLERHRLLWLFLKHETDFFDKPLKLLHFAPEQAFYKRFRALKNIDYTTTDLNSPLADVKADICDLPFQDESFDVVLCNHVLEHIKDDTTAMMEIFRILKKDGWAILQIPQDLNRDKTFEDNSITDPKERSRIFGQYDHVRIYGLDYFDKLESIGFQVHPIEYTNSFSDKERDFYRLPKREVIPFVKKPED